MDPSFFTSAGARFIVILLVGNSNSQFFKADLTLFRDSFTEVSGSPTTSNEGNPLAKSASIVTKKASNPISPRLFTLATIKIHSSICNLHK